MIKPTVGRVVWFHAGHDYGNGNPLVAFVTHVWSDHVVNVAGFDAVGLPFRKVQVPLLQDFDTAPTTGQCYAEWMPYQQGQAAQAADLAKRVAELERIIKGLAENQAAKLAEAMLAEDAADNKAYLDEMTARELERLQERR